ncbi:PEP-CTERM sorting domain-containing protein [Spirulina subsalsa]|uniref:PEP-CTERM sorting domain-containing protein n=1 Tax=Spirulina subsalsa TaxID=54311 RepID=UPI00037F8FBB|nr:PEP-CTERM sorting domain-containing protein [Spirulina subsalsa]
MKNLVKFVMTAGAALTLFLPSPVQAFTRSYTFELINITGPLSGEKIGGSFSFDATNMRGEGRESTSVRCLGDCSYNSHEFDGQLSFSFDFFGTTYTEEQEMFNMPIVYFLDGVPTRIYYRKADRSDMIPHFRFSAQGGTDAQGNTLPLRMFEYHLPWPDYGMGNASIMFTEDNGKRSYSSDINIPEPGVILGLVTVGLLGIATKKNSHTS